MKPPAICTPIKPGVFQSHPTEATRTLSYFTFTTPTSSPPCPSRIGQRKSFFEPTRQPMICSRDAASNLRCTKWTTKRPRTLKPSSIPNASPYNTPHRISIAQTPPNEPFVRGKITSSRVSPAFPNPSPSPTGVASHTNAITLSICSGHVAKTQPFQRSRRWTAPFPSTLHPWRPRAQKSSFT